MAPSSTKLKRSKKTKRKKKEEKKRASSYCGTDLSTGDDKIIHGFKVSGVEIDKALVPAGLSSKNRAPIVVEAAVDVAAALPGIFSASHSQMYDEVQGVTEVATTMLTTFSGKRAQLHDTQCWKALRKTSLVGSAVKKESYPSTLIKAVDESSTPAFDQQDSRIRLFLYQRRFEEDGTIDYLEHGLLPVTTRRPYEYFVALLNRISFLYHRNNNTWYAEEAQLRRCSSGMHRAWLTNVRAFSIDY